MSDAVGASHPPVAQPSAWVCRWVDHIPRGGTVLDLACGSGRHARMLARLGYRVHAVDRDAEALAHLAGSGGITALQADLEAGRWPYEGHSFDGIIVTNYLFRPLLRVLVSTVAPGGILVYETFASGNEAYGRPSNPDFLLRPGELLEAVRGSLRVVAYEDLKVDEPKPAMVQRICARHERSC